MKTKSLLGLALLSASALVVWMNAGMTEASEVKKAEAKLAAAQQKAKEDNAECTMRKEQLASQAEIHKACHEAEKANVELKHAQEKLATARRQEQIKRNHEKRCAEAEAKRAHAVAKS